MKTDTISIKLWYRADMYMYLSVFNIFKLFLKNSLVNIFSTPKNFTSLIALNDS